MLWGAASLVPPASSVSEGIRLLLFLPGTFAPAIVATWLTWRDGGSAAVQSLFDRLFQADVKARWYAFALGYMVAIKLAAAAAHRVITGGWPAFGSEPIYLLPLAVAFSTPFQAGEEIGWRGYALPRMASRIGLSRAGLLLGLIWGLWHLPLFVIVGADNTGRPFPVFVLSVMAISVAMTWLYANTRGSLLLVMLMHAAINNTKDIVPSATGATGWLSFDASRVAWLTAAFLWIVAAFCLVRMPRASRTTADTAASTADRR